MKAAVFEQVKSIAVRDFEMPVPVAGEILIKIEYCLLCTWEQRIFTGESSMKLPFIAGHEASGVVEHVPEDTATSFKEGDNVVFKTLDHCGNCTYCYLGDDNQCIGVMKKRYYGGVPGSGGLAQFAALPVSRVFPVFSDIPLEEAAFAEPLACCIHSVKRSNIHLGDTVVIFGAGIMGQLHALLARLRGARVIVVEPDSERRNLACELGAYSGIDPFNENVKETIDLLTRGEGADIVFVTTNNPDLVLDGQSILRRTGRLVLYGSFHPNKDLPMDPNGVHYSEVVITGSSGPATSDFLQASRLLSYELLPVKKFIYDVYPLDKIMEAFEAAGKPDSYRVVVKVS